MKKFAQIYNNKAWWIFDADTMPQFAPGIVIKDITNVTPQPQEGWGYNASTDTFSGPVVPVPTLADAQASKITQIESAYNQKLTDGFTSSATGTQYTFRYRAEDILKFLQLDVDVKDGNAPIPTPIPAKDGTIVYHNLTQYGQLKKDISTFAWAQQNKLHTLTGEAQSATTINALSPIDFNDTTPPTVPTGLKFASGALSWTANTEADLKGYNVYQSSDNKTFTKVNASVITSPTYTPTGLTTGSTYYFTVSAVDVNTNESAQCASITVTA